MGSPFWRAAILTHFRTIRKFEKNVGKVGSRGLMSSPTRGYRATISIASLIIGPLLMSIGDLLHPAESLEAAEQAGIITENAFHWYAAHLLLFFGILLFIPGVLALVRLTAERHEPAGYATRTFLMIGISAFSAIFVAEMLIGRYVSDGADVASTTALLQTFQSIWILGAAAPAGLCFFAGVAVFAVTLTRAGGPLRWPALAVALGAILILVEIVTGRVLLSQIGNPLILAASVAFAWHIWRHASGLAAE